MLAPLAALAILTGKADTGPDLPLADERGLLHSRN
jgi:hypothetical protein